MSSKANLAMFNRLNSIIYRLDLFLILSKPSSYLHLNKILIKINTKLMNEIFLPLDRSPLVNMRRAIKRTNAKRLANLVIDS